MYFIILATLYDLKNFVRSHHHLTIGRLLALVCDSSLTCALEIHTVIQGELQLTITLGHFNIIPLNGLATIIIILLREQVPRILHSEYLDLLLRWAEFLVVLPLLGT